jgi:hypothetical protein
MACALTQGYSQDCRDVVGGAKEIYFMEHANATTITVAAGVVTAITKATGKRFWKYKPPRETAYGKETITANVQNGSRYYAQEVGIVLNKLQTNTSLEIQKLAQNLLLAVVRDANDVYWLYGYKNGLDATGGEGGTGTAPGDRNGYNLVFTGAEPSMAMALDSATAAALETPGS